MGWLFLIIIIGIVLYFLFIQPLKFTEVIDTTPDRPEQSPASAIDNEINRAQYPDFSSGQQPVSGYPIQYQHENTFSQIESTTNFEEANPDKDAWEGAFWDALNPTPVQARLEFSYTDGDGKRTHRAVNVREFDTGLYGGMLIGHCNLRHATRTFRYDSMTNCVDTDTGEVIENISAYLRAKYDASPEATMDKLFSNHSDILRALLFLGKADGRLTKKERDAILEYVKAITSDERLNDVMLKQVFRDIEIPTLLAFKQCCGRIAKNYTGDHKLLVETAKRMVATEKKVSPLEQEALDYLQKRLSLLPVIPAAPAQFNDDQSNNTESVSDDILRRVKPDIVTPEPASQEHHELTPDRLSLDYPAPPLVFQYKFFCFTGGFLTIKRRECETLVSERGGIVKPRISRVIDYLVIGGQSLDYLDKQPQLLTTKMNDALALRTGGAALEPIGGITIKVISEYHFKNSLSNNVGRVPVDILNIESSTTPDKAYVVSLNELTCNCPNFSEDRAGFAANDPRRLCKHLVKGLTDTGYIPDSLKTHIEKIAIASIYRGGTLW